jgi:tetratricopeptide (TPR) repeat protein
MASSLQALLDSGLQMLQSQRFTDAQNLSTALLAQYPQHPLALLFAADTADATGDPAGALRHLEAVPSGAPRYAQVALRKAQLLFGLRRRAEARAAALAAASRLDPDPAQFRALAQILSDCQDPESARIWLLKALERFPEDPQLLADVARAEFHVNRVDDAEEHLATLLRIQPFHAGALHLRSTLRTQTIEQNHIADLERKLQREPSRLNLVVAASFALAKEYEDLQQYDDAFTALDRGARAYRSTLRYDSASELAAHAAIREKFTAQTLLSVSPGYVDEGPIFIVGMPRTGTTLVERILTSHTDVSAAGELTDFPLLLTEMVQQRLAVGPPDESDIDASLHLDFHELGRRYVDGARQLAGGARSFVDKLPYNFLYCGYILAALPRAKIIHLRRDPLDTCYAVYKTLFFNAYSFSYDLQELADYYVGYRTHMDHWHRVLPGRILDVIYEDFVRDPELQARRVLDWCGLPWQASVLEFHAQQRPSMTASAMQVRKPIYTHSIGAWRRSESALAPVRERLQRAGLITPGDTPTSTTD